MPESKTYVGSCHCGAVCYDVSVDLSKVLECNCSHCERKGLLLSFVSPTHFTLKSGEDKLTEYQFNKHIIQHFFCNICGVQPFARGTMPDGKPAIAVNVRCLEGVEISTLNPMPFDGRGI